MHKPLRTVVNVAVLSVLAAGVAHAGSFSLYTESSPAAIGNYAAGVAAEAADASTGWYNPAGLALLHNQQAVFGGVGVFPSSKLTGKSTFTVSGLPDGLAPFTNYTQTFEGIQGAENAFVPAFHYALPLGENTTFGFSAVSPFGLSTDWGITSPVRYAATLSELITMNFSPELGTRLTKNVAVGAGLDLQYSRVKLNRMLGIPNILNIANVVLQQPVTPLSDDTLSYNKGNSFGVGYHLGVMGLFNDDHTRVGLNYQSKMRQQYNGYSELSGSLASTGNVLITPVLPYALRHNNNLSSAPIQFPDVITLSAYHDLNESLALLGSLVYTGWSCFDQITLNNVPAPNVAANGTVTQVNVNASTPENYNSAWRAAIGANYHVNQQWMLRVGGGYDQTPTNNIDRDVRLPDPDRWALSVGAHYQAKPNLGFDVGYTHLFAVSDPVLNNVQPLTATSSYTVNATGSVHADLLGAQVVWNIDQPTTATSK